MSGRGRPRRAKSPESVKSNTRPEERQPKITKERQPKTTKERQPKTTEEQQPKTTKERQPKTTKERQPKTTEERQPKTTKERQPKAREKKQSETVQCTQVQTGAGRAVKQETKTESETAEDAPKSSLKTTKVKPCGAKARSPVNIPARPTQPEETPKPRGLHVGMDSILRTTLERLTIKRVERSDAAEVINEIVKTILDHFKGKSQSFKEVEAPLRTGSYYENLKISSPDEFDVMLPIPVDRVNVLPFGEDGAFYSVELKRGNSPLEKFKTPTGTLSASRMLQEFRDEVKKSIKQHTEWEVTKKKKGCPAVTLVTTNHPIPISLDIVLSVVVKSSWPAFTTDGIKIDGWLGTKVKQQYRRMPYYLVPKYEGVGTVERGGVLAKDVWRVSFSHVEKAMLLNHGSEKTCCERGGERCCRKDCLKLLKHLLGLLKDRDSAFSAFCSYHAKTTLLHACCSRTRDADWRAAGLSHCFLLLLEDFVARLESGVLYNFFIPTQNLLSGAGPARCRRLAQRIQEERREGFPIFK